MKINTKQDYVFYVLDVNIKTLLMNKFSWKNCKINQDWNILLLLCLSPQLSHCVTRPTIYQDGSKLYGKNYKLSTKITWLIQRQNNKV